MKHKTLRKALFSFSVIQRSLKVIRKQLDTFALQYSNTTVEGLKAPCTLYGALMKASTLDNLDYALNAKALGTVGTLPFCISTTLTVNESMLSYQHVVLRVCDLSAPANFTVGEGRFSLDDEQRVYTLEIGQYLKEGKNLLCFEFLPETSEGAPYEGDGFFDRGIFRRLEIIAYNESFIDNIKCRQVHENGKVTLHISAKTYGDPTGSFRPAEAPIIAACIKEREAF